MGKLCLWIKSPSLLIMHFFITLTCISVHRVCEQVLRERENKLRR